MVSRGGCTGGDDRLRREIEWDAKHVRVLYVEFVVFVELVGLAAKRPADHLFAEELSAESAHAEDMRDGVGVPTFREHGD